MVFSSQPLPLKRAASCGVLCGWMNSTRAEFLRLGPDRMKPFTGKSSPSTLPPIAAPFSPLLHRGLELLHRQVGVLQTERGKSGEAVRPRGADFRQLLVVDLDDLSSYVAILGDTRTD